MKRKVFSVYILLSIWLVLGANASEEKYDICVYGGTSAGVIAAYTAKMSGKSVVLIEPGRRLGGLSSGGLGYTDIGNKYAISGLALDFYRRVGDHYGKFEQWIFEPSVAEKVFKSYVSEAGFKVVFQHRLEDVVLENGSIKSIKVNGYKGSSDKEALVVSAKMFIDCSYEGDLMAKAGVSYTTGRESNAVYNETYNGVQLMDGHQFPDGISPYKIPDDPSSGLLWGISPSPLMDTGSGDKKIQAYNFRICLTDRPENKIAITRPENYDSTRYDLLVRVINAQPTKRKLNDYFIWSKMPNGKTDINNRGSFSTDMIGMNHNYPEGDYETRADIVKAHEDYTKGLLYFFGHDSRVPLVLRNEMLKWGYPKDEYIENGNWSPQLYVREVRRMVGEYVMTQAHCTGEEVVSDGVGMAAYQMDSHNCQRIVVVKDGVAMVKNEGNVEIGGLGPYPISYRSLISKSDECKNLFVPVCLSASHIAYGSIRMEPVFMQLAQSVATAAVMAIDENQAVQDIDVNSLQEQLKTNPLADGSVAEIQIDNRDKESVTVVGDWSLVKRSCFGPDMLLDNSKSKDSNSFVKFNPDLPFSGTYKLYFYYPRLQNGSSVAVLSVFDGVENHEVKIERKDVIIEGQTSGDWVYLGDFKLPEGKASYLKVTNRLADGDITADAVRWIPN